MTDAIYCIPFAFCLACFRLEKFYLLLPRSRCNSLHFSGFFAIIISLRFCRYLVYQFVLFLVTDVLSRCYPFSPKLLLCFSFPGMRSSLVCLFVSSWLMLFIVFPLHFACFVSGSRSFLYCCLVADIIHFSGFFAISISLRFCRFLVYQFVLVLITGVLSNCYTFSLKATTLPQFSWHEKFIYSFVPSWPMFFIALLLSFITKAF